MALALGPLFDGLSAVSGDRLIYSVGPIPGYPAYFIGKDNEGKACLLISVSEQDKRQHAPIRLESLEVLFEVPSLIRRAGKVVEGTFTVVRCRSTEQEIVRYFLSVAETLIRILGLTPKRVAVGSAINHLAHIFQKLQSPPARPVNGLFGELFLIRHSGNPFHVIAAWRPKDTSRFDFNTGDIRLDVKTASGRRRTHTFSYEQCNPPSGTLAIAASLFAERVAGGLSLRDLIRDIEALVATNTDLVMKLHDTVAETLGSSLQEALSIRFDQRLAASSLQFYDLRSIPAIRDEPPAGVSDIHFQSDLSNSPKADIAKLLERQPAISDFVPNPDA
jgi:hypothetical protein